MRHFLIFTLTLLFSISINAQDKKTYTIKRTANSPKIDGVLDDEVWNNAEIATDFVQFRPEMGLMAEPNKKTIVKMAYDDNAIYLSAHLKDNPEDIQRQLTSRDNFGNSDFFVLVLNPNNDSQNDTQFFVFSSGTQADAILSPGTGQDFGWSAVWDSAVQLVDDGWILEMEIPYRALRFSNETIQTWGIQFHRRFRLDNSQYSWNPIDRSKGNFGLYHGELKGIENIEPPTRLNLYPFVSSISNNTNGDTKTEFKTGLDIKYGVTENFTLDATLIPDFSQAGFDDLTLNLGPFEQTFGEQRQFFKEGVDLFNKGNLFFSRRIGNGPTGSVTLNNNEVIDDYPDEVKVLNAAKLSGRTKKGLGIGIFNAITEKTNARIKNTTTGEIRDKVVEPLSNYNIIVVDKQFNGNSSISLINTNVTRNGNFRDGNVTGLLASISNKRNTYNVSGELKTSNVNLADGTKTGFSSSFGIAKIHGNWRYRFNHDLQNDKYDINDIGLNVRNNFSNFSANVSYQIFEPTEKLNNLRINASVDYNRLYKPNVFTGTRLGLRLRAQNKKLMWFGGSINFEPGKIFDYFEPRDFENRRFFIFKNVGNIEGFFETNRNKRLSLEAFAFTFKAFDSERDLGGFGFGINPSMRFNENFRLGYDFTLRNIGGSRGYVDRVGDDIIFGERDIFSLENSISGNYTFNPFHSISLTFRNFWSTVDYDTDLFTLEQNGTLNTDDGYTINNTINPNVNFNTWNLDLNYTWQVAPGSFLTALYRNRLFNQNGNSSDSYFDSLSSLFEQSVDQTFSLRLQYFIDYNSIKGVFKRKNKTS